jgi:hypothetical protein
MYSRSLIARFPRYAYVIALASACSEPVLGPSASVPATASLAVQQAKAAVDISGDWTYHEDATFLFFDVGGGHATKAFRCSSDGTYNFVQTGDAFTGSLDQVGVCTAADGTSFPNDFTDVGVSGTIQGRHLRFADNVGCAYEATVQGPTSSVISGSDRCGGGGTFGTYRGIWSATR